MDTELKKFKLSDHKVIIVTLTKKKMITITQEHNIKEQGYRNLNFNSEEAEWEELNCALTSINWVKKVCIK